jgi:molybdopterin biosynthesis enzyme
MPDRAIPVSFAEAVRWMDRHVLPVPVRDVPAAAAVGHVASARVVAAAPFPPRAVALRDGVAVAAEDTVGADAHSPVFLTRRPGSVVAGDALPPGADAVIAADALTDVAGMAAVTVQAWPGVGARLAGHDLAPGESVMEAGAILSPAALPALLAAGEPMLSVRRPRVGLSSIAPDIAAMLGALLAQHGCEAVRDDAPCDLRVRQGGPAAFDGPFAIAVRPGDGAALGLEGALPVLRLPLRFDGAAGAMLALLPPMLRRLAGGGPVARPLRLSGKLASTVGFADVALLALGPDGASPVTVGEITLAGLLRATHWTLVPADSEGVPAGGEVAAWPFPGQGI